MPDINVSFMHPIDGRVMTVTVDDTMTAQEAVGELLANDFVPAHPQGYQLSVVETGAILQPAQTLAAAGVKSGAKLKVLPMTEAGKQNR
jgi:hypothetical protein